MWTRTWGLSLLGSGMLLSCSYGAALLALAFFGWGGWVGRLRGILYLSGLIVVPATLVLLIAGCTLLLRKK